MIRILMGKEEVNEWFKNNVPVLGQPLPKKMSAKAPGIETAMADFDGEFFNLIVWLPESDKQSLKEWKNEALEYGVCEKNNIPFFLITFSGNVTFEASLNIKKVADTIIDEWLNSESNCINIIFCDKDTNKVLGMRTLKTEASVSERVRDILEQQDVLYETWQEVDAAVMEVYKNIPAERMLKSTKMLKSKR